KAGSAGRKKSISAKGTRTRAATSATARKRVSLKATVRPLTAADNAPVSVASPQKRIPGIRSQGDGGGASGNGAVYRNVPKVNPPPDTNPSPTQVSGEVGRARWVDHVKARRQVLIVVGLSFAAGILFHALLEPDPPPQPVPVTADREQAGIRGGGQRETGVDQSVPSLEPQWSGYGVQPAPSTGYFPAPQPSPTDNGYTPGTPGFRSYSGQGGDATWPREGSPRQYPIKRWDEQTPDQGWVSPRENRNRDRTEQHTFGGSLGEERYPYSRPW
ncbi:MAG: hypothetical protein GY731_03040, partial [Gammaproteobacteria bacterium]|nr:hypothetical protein [Gammaproteobacteria bacterium]